MTPSHETVSNRADNFLYSLLVQDAPGVLQRICALLTRRGMNIDSITVGSCEEAGQSRITLRIAPDLRVSSSQILHQLSKLIDVLAIEQLPSDHSVRRELALITLSDHEDTRSLLRHLLPQDTGCSLLPPPPGLLLVQAVMEPNELERFIAQLRPFLTRIVRTGTLAEHL